MGRNRRLPPARAIQERREDPGPPRTPPPQGAGPGRSAARRRYGTSPTAPLSNRDMKTDRGVLDRTSYSGNSRAHEDCHGLFGEEAPQGPGRDSHCFGDILRVAPVLGVHQEGPEVVLAVVPRLPAPKQRNEQGMDLPKASTPAQKPPCPLPSPICPSLLKLTCHFIISTYQLSL